MPGNCGACSRMLAVMLALLGCLIVDDMLQLGVFIRTRKLIKKPNKQCHDGYFIYATHRIEQNS